MYLSLRVTRCVCTLLFSRRLFVYTSVGSWGFSEYPRRKQNLFCVLFSRFVFFIVLHKTQSRVFFVTIACCWCFGVPLLCFFLFLVSLNVFCITTATTTRSHRTVFQSSVNGRVQLFVIIIVVKIDLKVD